MDLKQMDKDGIIDSGFRIISLALVLGFIGLKLVLQHGEKIPFHNPLSDRLKNPGSKGNPSKAVKTDSTGETDVPQDEA